MPTEVRAQAIRDPKKRKEAVLRGELAPERFDTWAEIAVWALVAVAPVAYVLSLNDKGIEELLTDRALFAVLTLGVVHFGQSAIDFVFIFLDKFVSSRIPALPIVDADLDAKSLLYVRWNRWQTVPYALATAYYVSMSDNIYHDVADATFLNTVAINILWFLMYDAFYYWFHRFLHVRAVYPYVHKHHHKNVSPFRGNIDAINTHPFEYIVGMYLHLIVMLYGPKHSIYGLYIFTVLSGIAASINHTRFNIAIPPMFHIKDHDSHHRHFTVCYGQYVMFFDHLFGTYTKATEGENKKSE